MRICLTILLIVSSIYSSAQHEKSAIKKVVKGIILYRFIPDTKSPGFYGSLKPKIVIDSNWYDFIPNNDANYSIISKNKQFEDSLGMAELYHTANIESLSCLHRKKDPRTQKWNCDSVLAIQQKLNIYDSSLYHSDHEGSIISISSSEIYKDSLTRIIYIALEFYGSIIQYEKIDFGEQDDSRITINADDTIEFDGSHSHCPFTKYESTLVVLNRVNKIARIGIETQRCFNLSKLELTQVKLFLYE